jgi:hypothetical protein
MINWHTVIVGMLAQFILALFVLRTQVGVSLYSTKLMFELMSFIDHYWAQSCDLYDYATNSESSITSSTSSPSWPQVSLGTPLTAQPSS